LTTRVAWIRHLTLAVLIAYEIIKIFQLHRGSQILSCVAAIRASNASPVTPVTAAKVIYSLNVAKSELAESRIFRFLQVMHGSLRAETSQGLRRCSSRHRNRKLLMS
jgi:hypothetical protein